MDTILDVALQMERDGERLYRGLAQESPTAGFSALLTLLADEEAMHARVLHDLRRGGGAALPASPVPVAARETFERLAARGERPTLGERQIFSFAQAQEAERASRDCYLQEAAEVDAPAERDLLLGLAEQELVHFQLIDAMVAFTSHSAPEDRLEQAAPSHRTSL